jgi:CubicO group peptidase (beta-lactamase class C family)
MRSLVLLALAVAGPIGAQEAVDPAGLLRREFGAAVESGPLAAVSVAVIRHGTCTRLHLGARSADAPAPPGDDTRYEIGSITKTLTAQLLALEVLAGRLALDTPVADLLPSGQRVPGGPDTPVTLGHLATHRSGLPRLPSNLRPKSAADPYADYTIRDLYTFLDEYTLPRAPGAEYEYSNLGYALLGHALSRHAGQDFGELVARHLARPMGLATLETTPVGGLAANKAPPHHLVPGPDGAARLVAGHAWRMGIFAPAGGAHATLDDMIRYLQSQMDGPRALPRTLRELMWHPAGMPGVDGPAGLGWHHRRLPESGHDLIWHNGQTGGYCAFLGHVPGQGLGLVALCNTAAAEVLDAGALRSLERLLDARHPAP